MSVVLGVKDLKVYYRTPVGQVKAVDCVNFTVYKDETLGVAGESGCGKSTLARAILRLVKPPCYVEGGKIIYNGMNLLSLDEETLRNVRWKCISYIPQSSMNALNPVLRIADQIRDAIKDHEATPSEDAKKNVAMLLETVGLPPETAKMYPHELSGGMKQRAVIAMAIALDPELIVADEPTTALDVVVQKNVLEDMVRIRKRLGASIVLISHDMAIHSEIVDRLAIMYAGKIVEVANVQDCFNDPLHPYTMALMQAIPSLGEKKILKGLLGYPPNLLSPPPGCRFHPRCPYVAEVCKSEEPQLYEVKPGRQVSCFLYSEK